MLDTAVRPMSRVPPGSRWLKKKKKRTAGQGGGRRQSASFYVERLGATWDDFTYKSSSLTGGVSTPDESYPGMPLFCSRALRASASSRFIWKMWMDFVHCVCGLPHSSARFFSLACVSIFFFLLPLCVLLFAPR